MTREHLHGCKAIFANRYRIRINATRLSIELGGTDIEARERVIQEYEDLLGKLELIETTGQFIDYIIEFGREDNEVKFDQLIYEVIG